MYALIGYPLGHSFSARFFNSKFEREHIKDHYELFPIPDIGCVVEMMDKNPDLKGFNITIPYKEKIIRYLDYISPEAEEIGAVNVCKIVWKDGIRHLKGYNSDAIGFRKSLVPILRPHMKNALVLGTGGASKAIAYVLNSIGIKVTKVSRKEGDDVICYDKLSETIIKSHHIIVNTTPLGMWPEVDRCPDIPYHFLTSGHLCYDIVYNPEMTLFMKMSSEQGATVKNGLEMLELQALAAWDIWQS